VGRPPFLPGSSAVSPPSSSGVQDSALRWCCTIIGS
jgi:hypothetical protein